MTPETRSGTGTCSRPSLRRKALCLSSTAQRDAPCILLSAAKRCRRSRRERLYRPGTLPRFLDRRRRSPREDRLSSAGRTSASSNPSAEDCRLASTTPVFTAARCRTAVSHHCCATASPFRGPGMEIFSSELIESYSLRGPVYEAVVNLAQSRLRLPMNYSWLVSDCPQVAHLHLVKRVVYWSERRLCVVGLRPPLWERVIHVRQKHLGRNLDFSALPHVRVIRKIVIYEIVCLVTAFLLNYGGRAMVFRGVLHQLHKLVVRRTLRIQDPLLQVCKSIHRVEK